MSTLSERLAVMHEKATTFLKPEVVYRPDPEATLALVAALTTSEGSR